MRLRHFFLFSTLYLLLSFNSFSQVFQAESEILEPVTWSTKVNKISDTEFDLIFEAKIDKGWHFYSQIPADPDGFGPIATEISFLNLNDNYKLIGKTEESKTKKVYEEVFRMDVNYFEDNPSTAEQLQAFVRTNRNVCYDLIANPMCLFLLCTWFKDLDEYEISSQNGKITKCNLYIKVINRIIQTYLRSIYPSASQAERKGKQQEIETSLQKLANINHAHRQTVFTEEDLRSCNISLGQSDVLKIGLLTSCYTFNKETDEENQLYQFSHKSFQDYFHTCYVCQNMSPDEQCAVWDDYSSHDEEVFMCGLVKDQEALHYIFSKFVSGISWVRSFYPIEPLLSSLNEFPPSMLPAEKQSLPGWQPLSQEDYLLPHTPIEEIDKILNCSWSVLVLNEKYDMICGYMKQKSSGEHEGKEMCIECDKTSTYVHVLNAMEKTVTGQLSIRKRGESNGSEEVHVHPKHRIRCERADLYCDSFTDIDVLLSYVDQTKLLVIVIKELSPQLPEHIVYKLSKCATPEICIDYFSGKNGVYKKQLVDAGYKGKVS